MQLCRMKFRKSCILLAEIESILANKKIESVLANIQLNVKLNQVLPLENPFKFQIEVKIWINH